MKIKLLLSASLLAVCGIASAQMAVQITDPARIAEIERHAQQLGAQPMAAPAGEHMHHGDGPRGDRMHRKHMREHRKHARAMRHHGKMHPSKAPMTPPPDISTAPAGK